MEPLGNLLENSWTFLVASQGLLGASWDPPERLGEVLGRSWGGPGGVPENRFMSYPLGTPPGAENERFVEAKRASKINMLGNVQHLKALPVIRQPSRQAPALGGYLTKGRFDACGNVFFNTFGNCFTGGF